MVYEIVSRVSAASQEPVESSTVRGMSTDTLIPLLFIGIPVLLVWLWALVDAIRNPALSRVARLGWVAAVVLLPGVGALLYVAVPGRDRLVAH